MSWLLSLLASAGAMVLAYVFKDTVLAWIFRKPNPAQVAVNTQQKMDQDLINRPSQEQAVKDLEDGSV